MMGGQRAVKVLLLYKSLLKESKKFTSYNFRIYAMRRIRDGFKEGKHLTDQKQVENAVKFAEQNLEVIKRQVLIGQLYTSEKLVIEKQF